MIGEFREFINRGSMVELAVGFVLGVAFQGVVGSLTDRVLLPLVAMLFGEPNFDALLTFGDVDPETGVPAGSVGAVLTSVTNLVLVALALFFVVRAYNRMQRRAATQTEEVPVPPSEEVVLLREIRDSLDALTHGDDPAQS